MATQLRQRFNSTSPRVEAKSSGRRQSARWVSRKRCIISIVLLIFLAVIGTLAVIYYLDVPTSDRVRYSIMFDAGSTGSRMHVFRFEVNSKNEIRLTNETYHRISPGLSSYANDPHQGAMSLKPMLDEALKVVPASEQKDTPVSLRATAGLRLLPEIVQKELLDEVRELFELYPFRFEHSFVDIMDGKDEGYYAWLMVAFTLGKKLENNSIATLDLGGGSTQITFQPRHHDSLAKTDHLSYFKIPGGAKQQMYVHSYLGGGLMYGRAEIFKQSLVWKNETVYLVESPCIHPDVNTSGLYWEYFGVNFDIHPDADDHFSFDRCYPLARNFIEQLNVFSPKELRNLKMYLMSYYYDRAVDTGLMREGVDMLKDLTVGDFKERADFECRHHSKHLHNNEFLCIDLTYIYALLHDGLNLADDTSITIAQELRGSAVSWALGAALSELKL